jgi:hypothetical protein
VNDGQPSARLTFAWPERGPGSWSLAGLIFVSLALHSTAFFLFQTKEPRAQASPRSAPSVQLLTPFARDGSRSPENEALLDWIATQDPALVAHIPGVELKGLLDIPYRPSFQTSRTPPLDVPLEAATIQFPPPRDPLALIRSAIPGRESPSITVPLQATQITVSPSLANRASGNLRLNPRAKAAYPVEPTAVLVGVSAKGEVRLAFLQQGSESAALDAEAAAFSEKIHFAPAEGPMVWGVVTFLWGDDAHATPAGERPGR